MAVQRRQHQTTEYEKALRQFHKISNRHVLVMEADLTENQKRNIFHDAELARCRSRPAGNVAAGLLARNQAGSHPDAPGPNRSKAALPPYCGLGQGSVWKTSCHAGM